VVRHLLHGTFLQLLKSTETKLNVQFLRKLSCERIKILTKSTPFLGGSLAFEVVWISA
jgi:hypothetical protein